MKDKLLAIQTELKAPKNQYNSFGKYSYRSCEDILESVKPLLLKHNLCLILKDEIVEIGGRIYVKAIAEIVDNTNSVMLNSSAFAREADIQKGMSEPQITGSASSYARKYALNGLFLIDDTKDDYTKPPKGDGDDKPVEKQKGDIAGALKAIKESKSITQLDKICSLINQRLWTEEESKQLDIANSAMRDSLK